MQVKLHSFSTANNLSRRDTLARVLTVAGTPGLKPEDQATLKGFQDELSGRILAKGRLEEIDNAVSSIRAAGGKSRKVYALSDTLELASKSIRPLLVQAQEPGWFKSRGVVVHGAEAGKNVGRMTVELASTKEVEALIKHFDDMSPEQQKEEAAALLTASEAKDTSIGSHFVYFAALSITIMTASTAVVEPSSGHALFGMGAAGGFTYLTGVVNDRLNEAADQAEAMRVRTYKALAGQEEVSPPPLADGLAAS